MIFIFIYTYIIPQSVIININISNKIKYFLDNQKTYILYHPEPRAVKSLEPRTLKIQFSKNSWLFYLYK